MSLTITLPDLDAYSLGKTEEEIRLDLAIFLYVVWKIPAGRCAEFAGISKVIFLNELGLRNIPVNYDVSAVEQDYANWTQYLESHDRNQRHHVS